MSRRLTVAQAAVALGLGETAVRQRVSRGTLPTERVAGRVYVVLPDAPVLPDDMTGATERQAGATECPTDMPPPDAPSDTTALDTLAGLLREERQRASAAEQAAAMYMERSRNLESRVADLEAHVEELLALPAHEEAPAPWWRRRGRR